MRLQIHSVTTTTSRVRAHALETKIIKHLEKKMMLIYIAMNEDMFEMIPCGVLECGLQKKFANLSAPVGFANFERGQLECRAF